MADEKKSNVHTHPAASAASLEERLAVARERRRAAESKREAAQAERELAAEVEAEEIAARDEEAIEKAETELGAVGRSIDVIRTDFGCVILKRPNAVLYKRFRDKGEVNTTAFEKLVRPCVVYPEPSAFDHMLDEAPATLDRCANVVVELAGFRTKETSPK